LVRRNTMKIITAAPNGLNHHAIITTVLINTIQNQGKHATIYFHLHRAECRTKVFFFFFFFLKTSGARLLCWIFFEEMMVPRSLAPQRTMVSPNLVLNHEA
jgi:hypothetical protein